MVLKLWQGKRPVGRPKGSTKRKYHDPEAESDAQKIHRLQERNENDDSEDEESDDEVDGVLYQEGEQEEIIGGVHQVDEIVEVDEEGMVEVAANGKAKQKKDSRNYIAKPLEEFEALDTEQGPFPAPELEFNRNGEGRKSIRMFQDKSPSQIVDDLIGDVATHIIKMYNLAAYSRGEDVKELTKSKFDAWLGIHLFLHTWRYPVREKYWDHEQFAGLNGFDLNKIMSYQEWLEVRRNLRFEDYDLEDDLKHDKAWKVRSLIDIVKATLKRVNPAPGQFLSLDEAMVLYTLRFFSANLFSHQI